MARLTEEKTLKWCGDIGGVPTTLMNTPGGLWIRQGKDGAVFIPPMAGIESFVDAVLDIHHKAIDVWPLSREVEG